MGTKLPLREAVSTENLHILSPDVVRPATPCLGAEQSPGSGRRPLLAVGSAPYAESFSREGQRAAVIIRHFLEVMQECTEYLDELRLLEEQHRLREALHLGGHLEVPA